MTAFAVWLKKKRISVEGFAVAIGIDCATVRFWSVGGAQPLPTARKLIARRFPDCPLADEGKGFALNRRAVAVFRGFPDEDQNEGYAELRNMSPDERIELAGFILRQYVLGILNCPELPRLKRSAVRVLRRGGAR